jgi:hypothetical protein
MKRGIVVILLIGAAGGTALLRVPHVDRSVSKLDSRIVQAAAAPGTSANSTPHTNHATGASDDASASSRDNSPATQHATGTAVGFTTIGGQPYLVTARSPAAVALFSSTIAGGGQPWFQCVEPVGNGTESAKLARSQFSGWQLRGPGGGAVQATPSDGQLLIPLPGSEQLICTLSARNGG